MTQRILEINPIDDERLGNDRIFPLLRYCAYGGANLGFKIKFGSRAVPIRTSTSNTGQQRTSAPRTRMSASFAEAVVGREKADVSARRSAIAGRADVDPMGGDFRL